METLKRQTVTRPLPAGAIVGASGKGRSKRIATWIGLLRILNRDLKNADIPKKGC